VLASSLPGDTLAAVQPRLRIMMSTPGTEQKNPARGMMQALPSTRP
jgi:hypothetical protein